MAAKKTLTLAPGTRVLFDGYGGRLGTVARSAGRHNGYYVRFDERANEFEPTFCRCYGRDLTPTDPKLHAAWEAVWPAFIDRSWAKDAPARDRR